MSVSIGEGAGSGTSQVSGIPLFDKMIQAMLGAQGPQALSQISVLLRPRLLDLALNDVRISVAASTVLIHMPHCTPTPM